MISLLPLLLLPIQDAPPTAGDASPAVTEQEVRLTLELPPGRVSDILTAPGAEEAIAEHFASREELLYLGPTGHRTWDHPDGMPTQDGPHILGWKSWAAHLIEPEECECTARWSGFPSGGGMRSIPHGYCLAELARIHGRHADVWRHLASLDVGHLQEALEGLLTNLDRFGIGGGMPVLVPLLPPVPEYDPETWQGLPPLREYTARGLVASGGGEHPDAPVSFDATTFDMTVSVPREGVEVKLRHVSGPPLALRVKVPVPPHMQRSIEYLDWDRLDDIPEYHELVLAPSEEERVIWVRCLPQDEPWPRLPPGKGFPADRELVVRTTADDPGLAQLTAFAEALDGLLPNAVRLETDPRPGSRDLTLDLSPGPRRLDKLRALVSQVEQLVLAEPERQAPR